MCWQLQTLSIFSGEFSVTIVGAHSSYNIYIVHIIPGYPVKYVYLHILWFLLPYSISLNDENCPMTIIPLHKAEIFLVS